MLRHTLSLLALSSIVLGGPAFAADQDTKDQAERLKREARVAAELGDFTIAVERIRDAARVSGDRATAQRAESVLPTAQPGGGSPFANFGEIIQLIQEQTTPPARWVANDGEGGTISISQQGVLVTTSAVMQALSKIDDDSNLLKAAESIRNANHNRDVTASSKLRMVSIPRLEAYVATLVAQGKPIPEDMQALAGLTRIDHLFVYPATGDIVVAGPAGEWQSDADGRRLNAESKRPVLNLDDLVTMIRTFGNGGPGFVCSIDPKQAQVAAVQDFVKKNRRSLNASTAAQFTKELERQLGLQNVIVQGVPADSHVAAVIVEADYRMKEIGIGKRTGVEGMKSYFDLLTRSEQRGSTSMDALRWWMAVGYDAVKSSSDSTVFEFTGNPIQCLSEDQIVGQDGKRIATGSAKGANAKFANLFTQHLPELAEQDLVFAELENIFDLAMVAALIKNQNLDQRTGWAAHAFAPNGFRTASVDVPQELMSAANFQVYNGRSVVVQVAGGVRADVSELLNNRSKLVVDGELDGRERSASPVGQQSGRWWWDASGR